MVTHYIEQKLIIQQHFSYILKYSGRTQFKNNKGKSFVQLGVAVIGSPESGDDKSILQEDYSSGS